MADTAILAPYVRYSEDIGKAVAAKYASGSSLRAIGATDGMPDYVTIWRWKNEHPEFATILACARAQRAEGLADEGLTIVDACGTEAGEVGKAREQGNYRRWLAGCLDRDTYGERPAVAISVGAVLVAFADMAKPVVLDAHDDDALPPVVPPDVTG